MSDTTITDEARLAALLFEFLATSYDPDEEYWDKPLVLGALDAVLIDGTIDLIRVAGRLLERVSFESCQVDQIKGSNMLNHELPT